MSEELKPCPFCGPGTHLQIYRHGPDEPDCFVQCDACTTCGPSAKTPELAAGAWNTRAALASTRTASDTRTAAGEAECDAALRAAPAGQHEDTLFGWQPIETAPKNGASILLYTGEGQIEARWAYGCWEQSPCYATYDGCGGVALSCEPTYWKPLDAAPAPPTKTGA